MDSDWDISFKLEYSIDTKSKYTNMYSSNLCVLIFPLYDRVVISNRKNVRSWKISSGEFEKDIYNFEGQMYNGVKVQEYRKSQKKFFLNQLLLVKEEGSWGFISIYSSRSLLELSRIITEEFYTLNLRPLPKMSVYGDDCFLGNGKYTDPGRKNLSPSNNGIIFIVSLSTGKIIQTLENQDSTNGSRVYLSKSIPNSFYYNTNSGTHEVKLISYENKLTISKSFNVSNQEFSARIMFFESFLNSRNEECCIAVCHSDTMYIFNTENENSIIHSIKLECTRPSCAVLVNERYLIYTNFKSSVSRMFCLDTKFLEERMSNDKDYQPKRVFKRIDKPVSGGIMKIVFDIDENGNFVKLGVLFPAIFKRFKVTGLEIDGIMGMAKMDLNERIEFLRNDDFKNKFFHVDKKESFFMKIEIRDVVIKNLMKSLVC